MDATSEREGKLCNADKTEKAKRETIAGHSFNECLEGFNKYVKPNLDFIYSLCKNYTDKYQNIDDNYNYVLLELYKYSYSYDPTKSLKTWLHICTKRACYANNKKLREQSANIHGLSVNETAEAKNNPKHSVDIEAEFSSLMESLSDEVYEALLAVPMLKLSPFLLQLQGYKTSEIVEMEYEMGHIRSKSIEVVRNRIFTARNIMMEHLKNNGVTRKKIDR